MTSKEGKKEVIDLLDKAYWAMNDVEDALEEHGFSALARAEASNIAGSINDLQQRIIKSQEVQS